MRPFPYGITMLPQKYRRRSPLRRYNGIPSSLGRSSLVNPPHGGAPADHRPPDIAVPRLGHLARRGGFVDLLWTSSSMLTCSLILCITTVSSTVVGLIAISPSDEPSSRFTPVFVPRPQLANFPMVQMVHSFLPPHILSNPSAPLPFYTPLQPRILLRPGRPNLPPQIP